MMSHVPKLCFMVLPCREKSVGVLSEFLRPRAELECDSFSLLG